MRRRQVPVKSAQCCGVANGMLDRGAFTLAPRALDEIDQHLPLAVRAGIDLGISNVAVENGVGDRAGCADGRAQVIAGEIRDNLLESPEDKHLVLDDGSADRASELLAVEIFEWLAVGRVRGQAFEPLEMKGA